MSSEDPPLRNGESLWSSEGEFQLILQADGNLVLYRVTVLQPVQALWASGAHGSGDYTLTVQRDGNLVLARGGVPAWSSGTGQAGVDVTHYLEVQNTRDVTVYRRDAKKARIQVWSRTKGALVGPAAQPAPASTAGGAGGLLGFLADVACAVIEHKLNEALQPPATRTSDTTAMQSKADISGGGRRGDLVDGWVANYNVSMSLYADGRFYMGLFSSGSDMSGVWQAEGDVLILDHNRGLRKGQRDRLRFALRGGRLFTHDLDTGDDVVYNRPGR